MPAIQHIPFRRIPQHSTLFLDYLAIEERALSLYRYPPTIEAVVESAREVTGGGFHRREMVQILKQQNELFHCGEKTQKNIEALESDDSVAVVTGQQVGLFTGPAYTIYKAMTTLRLAEELRSRSIPAVPVFWMESEDHDLAEVMRFTLLDRDQKVQSEDSRQFLFGDRPSQQQSVGSISLPDTIENLIEQYTSRLTAGAGYERVISLLESTYRSGFSLCQAFGRLMSHLFSGSGLVLFDSQAPAARALVSGLFGKAIGDAEEVLGALQDRTRLVEDSGFHGQVKIQDDSALLFLRQDEERKALVREGAGFYLKNSDRRFDRRELIKMSREAPERFSPNVLLRPLVQDSLFPTAAYVGGPSEIAYFAQLAVLYQHFHRHMPVIWPRSSITILDADLARGWHELGLSYEDCFTKRDALVQQVLKGESPSRGVLDQLKRDLSQKLGTLGPVIGRLDPTLKASAATAERKIIHNIDKLQARITKSEERKNQDLVSLVDGYINQCCPDGHPQERVIGISYFISRYGPDLIEELYPFIETGRFEHCIIEMDHDGTRGFVEKPPRAFL